MLTEILQTVEFPVGSLVKVIDRHGHDVVTAWDSYPGVHGYHSRVDVSIVSDDLHCLVLQSIGNFRRVLLKDQLLWFDIDHLKSVGIDEEFCSVCNLF